MSISVRPGDVRALPLSGAVGQLATASHLAKRATLRNTNSQAAKVTTIVVDTAANSTAYAFTFEGETITYTSDGSATKPEISAGLKAAFDANPIARGVASVADDGVDTLTITGLSAGYDYAISESDANLTLSTVTAAASASAVSPGVLCAAISADSDGVPVGGAAKSSLLTAQVDSYVITYDASVDINVTVEVDGIPYLAQHTMATDLATSGAAIAAQLNAVLPANTVLAAFDTDTLTLTSEVAGKPFVSGVGFGPGRDTGAATRTSNAGVSTDITRAAAGVSIRRLDEEAASIGASYTIAALAGVEVLTDGEIWVSSSESVSFGDPVYVELGASNSGQFYKTSSSTRVKLPADKFAWIGKGSTSTDNIARLRVSL